MSSNVGVRCLLAALMAVGVAGACTPAGSASPASTRAPAPARAESPPRAGRDTTGLVPAGYGSLRQDDIALRMQRFALQIRLLPLDESVIRLLSPDSYRALRELRESRRAELAAIERRTGARAPSLWYVSFFSAEPGEVRFSPMELVVSNVGRDFRPLDVLPLTPGFGEQRIRQRETQSGLLVFDGQLDLGQPLTVSYETASNGDWGDVLQLIERERSLVRSRAARATP